MGDFDTGDDIAVVAVITAVLVSEVMDEEDERAVDGRCFISEQYERMADREVVDMFRFSKAQIEVLIREVFFFGEDPDDVVHFGQVKCGRPSCLASKLLATLVFLYRMAFPCKMSQLGHVFFRSRAYVGSLFHYMLQRLLRCHGWLLHLPSHLHTPALMEAYADAFIRAGSPVHGEGLQPRVFAAVDGACVCVCVCVCVEKRRRRGGLLLISRNMLILSACAFCCYSPGTFLRTLRPSRHQRAFYSGYKHSHGLNFLGVVLPTGLLSALIGPVPGRYNDPAALNQSHLLEQMHGE
jgi:hypothetical protein